MIWIERPTEVPETLLKQKVEDQLQRLRDKAENGQKPTSTDFKGHEYWQTGDVKTALADMQYEKCAYCECDRRIRRELDVEHFRPKLAVKEAPEYGGYWWLAYKWENLFLACKQCNEDYKATRFPLDNEDTREEPERDGQNWAGLIFLAIADVEGLRPALERASTIVWSEPGEFFASPKAEG